MRWIPRNWNDSLSLVVIVGVPALWVWGHLDAVLIGGTLGGWMLVLQHYYRKAGPEAVVPHG